MFNNSDAHLPLPAYWYPSFHIVIKLAILCPYQNVWLDHADVTWWRFLETGNEKMEEVSWMYLFVIVQGWLEVIATAVIIFLVIYENSEAAF